MQDDDTWPGKRNPCCSDMEDAVANVVDRYVGTGEMALSDKRLARALRNLERRTTVARRSPNPDRPKEGDARQDVRCELRDACGIWRKRREP